MKERHQKRLVHTFLALLPLQKKDGGTFLTPKETFGKMSSFSPESLRIATVLSSRDFV